ncbi:MAG: DNA repair protein RadC [Nanoarchaeota archaeon]
MKIKDIPFYNRPGFKLTRNGVHSLDDAELLAIIFGIGNKDENAIELSNRLLKKYNFNRLEHLGLKELAKELKSYNKAMQMLSLVELAKRYNKLVNNGHTEIIRNAKDVYNIFSDKFREYKQESLNVILLDTKNKIINTKEISIGTLNSSLMHPREIFKEAIRESAYSIIIVHNHPSGDPEPSKEDIEMTKKIIEAGKLLNILVLDHVIIGKDKFWNWLEAQS